MEFKVGQKVIPISKSVGNSWEDCSVIHRMKQKGQSFLYIIKIRKNEFVCAVEVGDWVRGNYFLQKDLKPFAISRTELNTQLLNGEINIETYQSLLKEVT